MIDRKTLKNLIDAVDENRFDWMSTQAEELRMDDDFGYYRTMLVHDAVVGGSLKAAEALVTVTEQLTGVDLDYKVWNGRASMNERGVDIYHESFAQADDAKALVLVCLSVMFEKAK